MGLVIRPLSFKTAKEYIAENHRHHKPPQGHKFSIGCYDNDKLVGVVVVGRPVARYFDDGVTAEVTRLCTDGTRNACSKLYASAWNAAHAMGYVRMVTYILSTELGTSLKASGWKRDIETAGGSWGWDKRPRVDQHPLIPKVRYIIGDWRKE